MIFIKVHLKPINGNDFVSCLNDLKSACLEKGIFNPVFILDNARIHHFSGVKELLANNDLKLLYLPPYSPFLNPIESSFSKWKNYVTRGNARNEEELMSLIANGFDSINLADCNGFYRKMLRYVNNHFLEKILKINKFFVVNIS